jgi:hypothetical protein
MRALTTLARGRFGLAAEAGLGTLMVLAAVMAGLFGGSRERLAVIVFAGLAAASVLASHWPRPHAAAWICMMLDLAALAWLGKVAWKASRRWPVWALAPQAVAVAISVAFLLQPDVTPAIYFRALLMTRCLAVLVLTFGSGQRKVAHP